MSPVGLGKVSRLVGAIVALAALPFPAVAQNQETSYSITAGYDPNPGPYIVFPQDDGALDEDQLATIQNVSQAWSANLASKLGHFHICYRLGADQRYLSQSQIHMLRQAALRSTTKALISAGAISVTTDQSLICDVLLNPKTTTRQAHVEIFGLIGLSDPAK